MKNNVLTKVLIVLALLFSTYAQATQLSGTYTIDPNGAATATNFKDFASAITYMTATTARADGGPVNSGTVGVSGPVVFNVAAATYNVTSVISIPTITGTSPINTVTFDGGAGNAATRIITGNISGGPIMLLNLCKYVTIANLTVNNVAAATASCIVIFNNTTTGSSATTSPNGSCNTISYCTTNLPNVGSNTSANIILSSATNAVYYGTGTAFYGDSIIIDNCTCPTSGYYGGINVYGVSSASYNRGIKFTNNSISNAYYYSMVSYYVYNAMDIMYNTLTGNNSTTYYGLLYYGNSAGAVNTGNTPTRIIGNKITKYMGYGLYCYYCNGTVTAPFQIYNNICAGSSSQSYYDGYIIPTSGYYLNIYNNTFVHNGTSSGYYAMYFSGTATANVKNNIFAVTSGGTSYGAYFATNPQPNSAVNYNNYYNNLGASGNLLYRGGAFTAANYQTAAAGGDSSFNVTPSWANVANYDFHLSDGCAPRGLYLPEVPLDVDKETRSLTVPVVGADEAGGGVNDIALTKVLAPTVPITLGLQDVVVRVKNVGTNVVNNFDISYKLNNDAVVSQTWTGTLNPCDEIQVIMTGPNQINLVSSNSVKIYTSGPNSALDSKRNNDSTTMILYAPLNGNYTIGGSSPDFTTFSQATAALSSGVMGPVNFDVRPGTYNEQVIVPPIVGTSPINQITFTGQNVSSTIVNYNTGGATAFMLNQCKYVTVQNITVNNTSGSGAGIAIIGNTTDNSGGSNTIKKCVINMANSTGTQYSLNVTGTASGVGNATCFIDSTTLDSNTINNGYMGIAIYGYSTVGVQIFNRYNRIRGNTLNNIYYMGMYLYYQAGGMIVKNNKVNMTTTLTQTNQYGIYGYMYNATISGTYKGSTCIFDGNIVDANYYGMYLYYAYGTWNAPTKIINNIIKPGFNRYSGGGIYGLYVYSYGNMPVSDPTPTVLVYNNTVYHNGGGSYYGFYFSNDGGANQDKVDIKNNIFACSSTSGGAAYIASNPNTGSTTAIDYNIYYRQGGGNVLYRNGLWYTEANVVSFAGGGANSYYLNPPPFSNLAGGDLHISNACTKGTNTLAWVPTDVDGEVRSATPNIGADEYPGLDRDISVDAIVAPVFPIAVGPQDLTLRVRNNGTSAINSFNLSYSLNGGPTVTYPWVGILNTCDAVNVTFTGANQVNIPNATNNLVAWTSNPNGGNDMMQSNDTLKSAALAPPLRGDYTIAPTGGDFNNLTTAMNAVSQRGIGGNVNFNVVAATYTEPASINVAGVVGLSDTSRLVIKSINNDPNTTIFQSAFNPLIAFTSTNYVRFNGVQLKQTVVGGNVMNLAGTIKNLEVYNSAITGPSTTTTSYLVFTGSSGTILQNCSFKKSTFTGNYYGLYLYATSTYAGRNSNLVIDSNTFSNIGVYYTYIYYTRDFKMRNNTFSIGNGSNTGGYVMGGMYNDSAFEISNNVLNHYGASYCYLYMGGYYSNGGYLPTSRGKIYNNVINHLSTGYGTFYYPSYYGYRLDMYNNRINNLSSTNYNYMYYFGYYSDDVNIFNNSIPCNSAYVAYCGNNTSPAGVRVYNNSFSSTTSYTMYYYYAGGSTGYGTEWKNNVLTNTGAGNVIYTSGTVNAFDKFDYNNFYTTGATMIAGGATITDMTALKAAGYCKNCISMDPGFTNTNVNLLPNLANANTWSLNGQASPSTTVPFDINGNPRSTSLAGGAQDIGAYEFTPNTLPPACTLSPVAPPVAGGVQVATLGKDTVARLIWAGGSVPTSVTVRLYSGTNPLNVVLAGNNYMNAYWDISVAPVSSYNYSLELYHKGIWQGTNPSASNMIGAEYTGGSWQYLFTSVTDAGSNKLNMSSLTNFGQFTGTDATTPFTPSFVVMSDKNKQNVVSTPLTVYPNPFNSDLNVKLDMTNAGAVNMNVVDITGKTIVTKSENLNSGINQTTLTGMNDLKPGIYFLTVEMNGQSFVQKLVKQ